MAIESKGYSETTCKEGLSGHDQGTRGTCITHQKQRRVVWIFAPSFRYLSISFAFVSGRAIISQTHHKFRVIVRRKREEGRMVNLNDKEVFSAVMVETSECGMKKTSKNGPYRRRVSEGTTETGLVGCDKDTCV